MATSTPIKLKFDSSKAISINDGGKAFRVSGDQLVEDRFGLASAVSRWWCWMPSPNTAPIITEAKRGADHTIWKNLKQDKTTVSRAEDGHWDVEATFYGVLDHTNLPEPVYQINGSLSSDPIETHPRFDKFAYKNAPTGSVFDDTTGQFVEFVKLPKGSSAAATNPMWIGVREFLSPSITLTETKVLPTSKENDLKNDIDNKLGKIDLRPPYRKGATLPSFGDKYRWLYATIEWEVKGDAMTVRREWRLSGPNGWNQNIYGDKTELVLVP